MRLTLPVILVALSATPSFADEIKEIIVEENTKSTDETVALIADVEVGDEWTPDMLESVKRELESSGLFKSVDVFWDAAKGHLHLVVRDKHSWVIAPAFYNQPTNLGVGVGFGENNLFGENKKLLLYGQVATGDSFFIGAYVDPSINGTRFHWQGDVYLKSGRIFEYAAPTEWLDDPKAVRQSRLNYLNVGGKIGFSLWRALFLDLRARAARVSYSKVKLVGGAAIEDVTGDPALTDLPKPGAEGNDLSIELALNLDTRANWRGVTTGDKYGVSVETSTPSVGSDFDYQLFTAQYQRARRVLDRHNLILKTQFSYGRNLPFQQEVQSGGTSMRGYKNSQFRGNLKAQANIEYSAHIFGVAGFSVRGLVFWDSSYVTFTKANNGPLSERHYLPNSDVRGLAPLKNSVGAGVRFYLQQIVLPLLGVDIGYGLERGDYEIYLAIGLTD
ncbi:MAG: BamA/TamA family outer membrane protein [Kofleriaceae bacterium]